MSYEDLFDNGDNLRKRIKQLMVLITPEEAVKKNLSMAMGIRPDTFDDFMDGTRQTDIKRRKLILAWVEKKEKELDESSLSKN